MDTVDLDFPLRGRTLPLDHGYALYGAVCRIVPSLHEHEEVGLHPVRGDAAGGGTLRVNDTSKLRVRTPVDHIPALLPLAGQTLALDGHIVTVGVPQVSALQPSPALAARMATVKGFMEPDGFLEAVRRQMDALKLSTDALAFIPVRALQEGGPDEPIRRVLRIKDKTIVGFALQVTGLTPEESLRLQAKGIGGRRHMGCGIFTPLPRS